MKTNHNHVQNIEGNHIVRDLAIIVLVSLMAAVGIIIGISVLTTLAVG